MNEIRQIIEKKKQLERQQAEKIRAEGRLEQLYSDLKNKYDCSSIEEARQKLQKMKRQIAKQSEKIEDMIEEWVEKYG